MKDSILIIGGGGHAKVLIELLEEINKYELVGIIDHSLTTNEEVLGYPVLGNDKTLTTMFSMGVHKAVVGIGSRGSNLQRAKVWKMAIDLGFNFPTLIHPHSYVSSRAKISEGCQILVKAVVNTDVIIGPISVINTSVVVEHECKIGFNVFTGTGSTMCGKVIVGDHSFIGANACLLPEIEIGTNCLVAAGALLTKKFPSSTNVKGVPAKPF
jgi:sugar O-acyltransferase (sialic acid O-acetyltransferase NeuD family)